MPKQLQPIGFYKSGRPIYPIMGGSEGAPEGAPEGGAGEGESKGNGQDQDKTFTQADVDRLIRERVQRERAKFSDYDDLKSKADGAKTLGDRIADIEAKGAAAEQRALRAEIAGEFGISTKRGPKGEPSDADLFLTGSDEQTLRTQAQRMAALASERRKKGNVAEREGDNPNPGGKSDMRDFTRRLFQNASAE